MQTVANIISGIALTTKAVLMVIVFSAPVNAAPEADLWPFWSASDQSSRLQVDHSDWGQFLREYLVIDADGVNKVNYNLARKQGGPLLKSYLESLASLDPRSLNKEEQFAYWVNLYNALTVQVVMDHPGKSSILKMGRGLFSVGPWNMDVVTLAGQRVTLNDIEHRILRPIWRDHRIHYAVNCASMGCPNLATVPYTAENTEQLLSQGERDYINHARGVRFDSRGRLSVSEIYDWYVVDFADSDAQLLSYLAKHHATEGDRITAYNGRIRYDYDWGLNAASE